jgi:uncharacterized damage-inducible protein DinB
MVNWKAETEIDRIIDELDREYGGDAWHGNPLTQLLDGIDHVKAAAKPIPNAHSIWEIVLHMIGWKNEVRRRLQGSPAGLPTEGDWPGPSRATDEAWADAVKALKNAHRALVAEIQRLPESRLFAPINDPRNRETGQGVSYYVLLHGIVQHDVYHSGQIALLKKALGR